MAEELPVSPVGEKLLLVVQSIRSHIPGWKRSLSDAATEATDKTPDFTRLSRQLHDPDSSAPQESADELGRTCVKGHPKMSVDRHRKLSVDGERYSASWSSLAARRSCSRRPFSR